MLVVGTERRLRAGMASSVPALPPLNGSKKKARRLDPAKAKARREEANPPAVFTHFTLNKDPECSKYMPYDEVAYPQLERPLNREQQYGEMETMWLQGFVDHTQTGEDKEMAASVAPFLQARHRARAVARRRAFRSERRQAFGCRARVRPSRARSGDVMRRRRWRRHMWLIVAFRARRVGVG